MGGRTAAAVVAAAVVVATGWYLIAVREPGERSALTQVGIAVFVVALLFLLFAVVLPLVIRGSGGRTPAPAGNVLVSASMRSGRIGPLPFPAALKVSVYADRLVVRPWFLGDRTIMTSEIAALTGTRRTLTIRHTGIDVRSPVLLVVAANDPLRRGIEVVGRQA